jgi:cation diffusion facilitator family transporter
MTSSARRLAPYAWLSIAAALSTIALKTLAYRITGSVGLLSDAVESLVNLAAAVVTLAMVTFAARPADESQGAFILLAAGGIGWTAVRRMLAPQPLEEVGLGLVVSAGAALINLAVARVLVAAGRRHHSIALEADGSHLMTDVWTSAGVVVGIGAVSLTGWLLLDAIVALAVAVHIGVTAVRLLRRSALGLLDTALPEEERRALSDVLERHGRPPVQFHAVRTRQSGARRFVSLHVLVPGAWSVSRGHGLLEEIERDIRSAIPHATVTTHLEPVEESVSWEDQELDRAPRAVPPERHGRS